MIIVRDSRRTIGNALQLLVQGEDELRKRKVLARISVGTHLGYDEGRKEGGALPQTDRTGISAARCHADLLFIFSPPQAPLERPRTRHVLMLHKCHHESTSSFPTSATQSPMSSPPASAFFDLRLFPRIPSVETPGESKEVFLCHRPSWVVNLRVVLELAVPMERNSRKLGRGDGGKSGLDN
jgi:hypothetical protein